MEQWLEAYNSCRLLALNLFSIVENPFTNNSYINYDKLYEIAYMQQRFGDNIVDLEIDYVNRIIEKIKSDPEPDEVKQTELNLWLKVKEAATNSRRTGCGFTALGDMLAANNLKYDSDEALDVISKVMKIKMQAELDATIDLSILRGSFIGWDSKIEYSSVALYSDKPYVGNDFYKMLVKEFPEQALRMNIWGRRNVSWSTVSCGIVK